MTSSFEPSTTHTPVGSPRGTNPSDGPPAYRAHFVAGVRGVLSVAAGLAIGAAFGQGTAAAATGGPLVASSVSVPTHVAAVEVDNSHADSWLEVDRTANTQTGTGDAGSDHEGGD
ncbi:hypothetical protein [Streptomyces sp. NBC_00344]|uniref:hypothetical protein n=1 Tax=Streptomyces sp. NBC_00344 TaxID=2975720 RepID=UPI002E208BF3